MADSRQRTRRPRSDAIRNRAAILEHARQAFAEHGIGASLDNIARGAGVAIGTLYRNFPNRAELVGAVYAEPFDGLLSTGKRATAREDRWSGLCEFLESTCAATAGDRGMSELLSIPVPEPELAARQQLLRRLGTRAVKRAQQAGVVRGDLSPTDILLLFWSHAKIAETTEQTAPGLWRRHLHILLDAYRADAAHPLPAPAMTPAQLRRTSDRIRASASDGRNPLFPEQIAT
ncbi:TetR/AcrR family transcriptional regulator [Sciscionella sediminilitoris]|uniref:TetR/AcrR family transcriptional regulator n=1 Tax=Sciscionella sediminilitoris TaxID=1445613 RepID=UPI0006924F11|nr:TetR/AcrR family transcriptional regulator [Sciscionella sp. SE31]